MENSNDNLDKFGIYKMSMQLWDDFWLDSEKLIRDIRGREIAKQLTKSVYSVAGNIEEGYGRGFGNEYPQFLKYSRGSAKESKGGYIRARFLLGDEIVKQRTKLIEQILSGLNNTLKTLKEKKARSKE